MEANFNTLEIIKKIIDISNNSEKNSKEKLQDIIFFLAEVTNTSKGSIMLKKDRLNMEVAASTDMSIIGVKQSLHKNSPSCWVFQHKKPLYVQKNSEESIEYKEKGTYKKKAFLVIPIIRDQEVIGVINLTEKKRNDCFSDEERSAVLDIAGIIISQIQTFRLAEELEQSQKKLSKQNSELQRLEKVRAEFFQMLIHDLKGPASEIIANLDILSYTISDENKEYLHAAQSGCDTMYTMISNLMDITRLEEGLLTVVNEKLSASDLISEASSRLFATSKNKKILIINDAPSTDSSFIWGDMSLLQRVLQNIIMNSIQHSNENSHIHTGFETGKEDIIFYIKDSGTGISPEHQDYIFDKYFQAKKETSSTGLGLAFCKLAVEAHNGKIWVESDGKTGSCFKFTIPAFNENKGDFEIDFTD